MTRMKSIKRLTALLLVAAMLICSLTACAKQGQEAENEPVTAAPTEAPEEQNDTQITVETDTLSGGDGIITRAPEQKEETASAAGCGDTLTFNAEGKAAFTAEKSFFTGNVDVAIQTEKAGKIYYTLDCTEPTEASSLYLEPIRLAAKGGESPVAHVLRAKVFYEDGTTSATAVRTYVASPKVESRFTTIVFFISGDPDELVNAPDGIFTGENYKLRGKESERMVYVEAKKADGEDIFAQFAGVRIYGGASREHFMKSMKLFARKSYDPDHGSFKIKAFGTPKIGAEPEEGETETPIVKKYDKLVLRNSGNDLQFSYIRDELSQTLVKKAGFDDYEAVLPAAIYLNGEYYGFEWLHENYCDEYFQQKYGKAEGEFVVIEGGDDFKNDDDDKLTQKYVEEYRRTYDALVASDLTAEANYTRLCNFLDIENYLSYFAFEIVSGNWDWPNNNYKCYRYSPVPGDTKNEGVYDGRWRYLLHDIDFTYGLYDSDATQPEYDNLAVIMDRNDARYAPLFTKLMEREDCREFFCSKVNEYITGAFSAESIKETYNELHALRASELKYFWSHMESLRRMGDWTVWSSSDYYQGTENQIYSFAERREAGVDRMMKKVFGENWR